MHVSITFDPETELELAARTLDRLDSSPPRAIGATLTPPGTRSERVGDHHPVVKLHQRTDPNESRRLLEALTTDPLSFEELADRMPRPDGSVYSSASMRAVYRNVKQQEKTLRGAGAISGPVVEIDDSGYHSEGFARYHLGPESMNALDAHLGR